MKEPKSIRAVFALAGFVAEPKLIGHFGDPQARVVALRRLKKRPCVRVAASVVGRAELKLLPVHRGIQDTTRQER